MRRRDNRAGIAGLLVVLAAVIVLGVSIPVVIRPRQEAPASADEVRQRTPRQADAVADAGDAVTSPTQDVEAPTDAATLEAAQGEQVIPEGQAPYEGVPDAGPAQVFVMPEGAQYRPQTAIVSVRQDATPEEVSAALSELPGIQAADVSSDDIAAGVVCVELAEGTSVEDAVNELLASDVAEAAQPDYLYTVADDGDLPASAEPSDGPGDDIGDDASDPDSNDDISDAAAQAGDGASADGAEAIDDFESQSDATPSATDDRAPAEEAVQVADADPTDDDAPEDDEVALTEAAATNDPKVGQQWALDKMRVPDAWKVAKANRSVGVAIMDVGFEVGHEDLQANVVAPYDAYAAVNGQATGDVSTSSSSHGTHVAGIIGAVADNGIGVAGLSYNARIIPIKIADSQGNAYTSSLLKAYDYVMSQAGTYNIRVINLSMGSTDTTINDTKLYQKIDEAYAKGIVTVGASGNITGSTPLAYYPSDYKTVVSVINVNRDGARASSSNFNKSGETCKNISAPGTDIASTALTSRGKYTSMTGTSMAAPHVSAVLALEFAANPSLSAKQAVDILYATADDLGAAGWDEQFGWGQANAYAAVYGAKYGVDAAKLRLTQEREAAAQAEQANRDAAASSCLRYTTHVESDGWKPYVGDGQSSGTTGRSLRLEGIRIKLQGAPYAGSIEYRTHIQNIGWESSWAKDDGLSGTTGRSLRLEGIMVRLTGDMANRYDVWYRVHAQNFGWMGWASNGEQAGTAGYSYRLEAIQIRILPKGTSAPGSTSNAFRFAVNYRTHVQNVGWQPYVTDGETSGTTGQSLRLEAINISLGSPPYSGTISYRTHIQNIGWESGWRSNGAMSGTSGRSLRLEAIQIKLTGELANRYDVWYRVHAQNFGWMGWASNGASAGTAGFSYRLEGIQIQLVEKGQSAPGSTAGAFRQK